MKKFLLYGHGGSDNRGSEAILRQTAAMIRGKYPDAYLSVSSHFPEQDRRAGVEADERIAPAAQAWQQEKQAPAAEKMLWARAMYQDALQRVSEDTVLLSVGGDNFCYQNWHRLAVFQERAAQTGAKSILWGASIEPKEIDRSMAEVLETYSTIIARESLTYRALLEKGIRSEIRLLPDIAFSLPAQPVPLPGAGGCVGINLSPLVLRREKSPGLLLEGLRQIVSWLRRSGWEVLLIPHVTMAADNDLDALGQLYRSLPERTGVHLAAPASAAQCKYMISHCAALVCARTHASIAAYSAGVPALVFGYSVKARGIAEDLGIPETVLDIDGITSPEEIFRSFHTFFQRRETFRRHLACVIPAYQAETAAYRNYL